jgi:NAD(P)-dependent dehydrogenase (short-subunit alcohol dehydrogenase family)
MNPTLPVAWITGGSSGIGYAAAEALIDGYRVVLSARREDVLEEARASLEARGGAAEAIPVDAMVRAEVDRACAAILDRHGRIDVLINSAGFNVAARQWHELDPDDFDRVIAGNLSGTFYAINAVLPAMRVQGGGVIVNVASMAGKAVSVGGGVAYTVAKHGVIALTASLNMAEFRNGVRACAISPGEVATPIMRKRIPPPPQEVLNRMLKPEDVGRAVLFAVQAPPHACIHEIVMAPTWNRAWL